MNDDYLWDKTGEPDPEVERLEGLLGRYAHRQAPPAFERAAMVVRSTPSPARVPTFAPLNADSLPRRLARAAMMNFEAFRENPAEWMRSTLFVPESEIVRARMVRRCLTAVLIAHIGMYGVGLFLTYRPEPTPASVADSKREVIQIAMLETLPPMPVPLAGGGGGREKSPASDGRLPRVSPNAPQVVAPSAHQRIDNPSLPVSPVVPVDPLLFPKPDSNRPYGLPGSPSETPSDGPGTGGGIGAGPRGAGGGGIGDGHGSGIGTGIGRGAGPGTGTGGSGGTDLQRLRPVILSQIRPGYTEEARHNKVQGTVVLSVEFRADGQIGDVTLLRGLGFGLDEKALEAARQIRFRPAVGPEGPVTVRAKVQFSFNLL